MRRLYDRLTGNASKVLLLLVTSFLLTALIALYALYTAQSNEQRVQQALEDQIGFAAWAFNQAADEQLRQITSQAPAVMLRSMNREMDSRALPAITTRQVNRELSEVQSSCAGVPAMPVQAVFMLDRQEDRFHYDSQEAAGEAAGPAAGRDGEAGGAGDIAGFIKAGVEGGSRPAEAGQPAFRDWLEKQMDRQPEFREGLTRMLYTGPDGRSWLVGLADLSHTPLGFSDYYVGFKLPVQELGQVFERIWEDQELLPQLQGEPEGHHRFLRVQIETTGGEAVFSGGDRFTEQVSRENVLGTEHGVFSGRMAIRRDDSRELLFGGIGNGHLYTLFALFGLAASLSVIALFLFRKETELSEMRKEFVSNVSHELRTPVTQIRMFAETLLGGRAGGREQRERALRIIDKESRRLSQLITNVLDFSRKEHGALEAAPEKLRIDEVLHETVEAYRPISEAASVQIRVLSEPLTATVDPSALRQVLVNVIDNAIKYGPQGQTVQVRLEPATDGFEVSVADEGPGIPQPVREKIWQPYWRSKPEETGGPATVKTGSGIGLTVVRQYLDLMGGEVRIESPARGPEHGHAPDASQKDRPDGQTPRQPESATKGTVFRFRFPQQPQPKQPQQQSQHES